MRFGFCISLGDGNRSELCLHELLARLPRSLAPRVLLLVVVGSGSHELLILLFIPSPRLPPVSYRSLSPRTCALRTPSVRLRPVAILDHAHQQRKHSPNFINHFISYFHFSFPTLTLHPFNLTIHLHTHPITISTPEFRSDPAIPYETWNKVKEVPFEPILYAWEEICKCS